VINLNDVSSRLEALKGLVQQKPNDSFLRYGLAMEYAKAGELERAIEEYRALLGANPDYAAAYYHGGQTLEKLGRREEAREMYRQGIEAATRIADLHTRSEIQAALDLLN
jgi:tetratricopeptide (TPR) repeat protein